MSTVENTNPVKIMLDTETYGTKPGCKLMSISAVTFMLERNEPQHFFNVLIHRERQSYLTESKETMEWWATQDQAVFQAMSVEGDRIFCGSALTLFYQWIKEFKRPVEIWCNGATFDAPVMEAAYKAHAMIVPWGFRDVRCYRTLLSTFAHLVEKPAFVGDKHNSLHDAIHQANYADAILKKISLMETMYNAN